MNAGSLWVNATSGDERTLQRAFFPEGLAWGASGFGTAVTCRAFSQSKMEWRPHPDRPSLRVPWRSGRRKKGFVPTRMPGGWSGRGWLRRSRLVLGGLFHVFDD